MITLILAANKSFALVGGDTFINFNFYALS